MKGQVPGDVARQRAATLRSLGLQKQKEYAERFVGRSLEVVVEGGTKEGGLLKGLARNYLDVHFNGDASMAGSVQKVRVSGWKDDSLVGELS